MKERAYSEIRFWSVTLGCDASRISVFDDQGQEHFSIVSMDTRSRRTRLLRRAVVALLSQHVNSGFDPGEVELGDLDALIEEQEVAA